MTTPQTDAPTLQERLRTQLVMSMFLSQKHLYQEEERQREEAADALDARDAVIADLVEALNDAIMSPMGVVPASADFAYDAHIGLATIAKAATVK